MGLVGCGRTQSGGVFVVKVSVDDPGYLPTLVLSQTGTGSVGRGDTPTVHWHQVCLT